ncbi:MAG: glycerophosphodiester phosphodiesterase [Acidimicrobiales bacterium]
MDNPWLERRLLNFAHQGGAREAPSSTMFAFTEAVAAGAHALEIDVHATADGHLVVCHDATIGRTTGAEGAIAAMTLGQLRDLDNAYWWVPGEVVAPGREPSAYPHRGRGPSDPAFTVATLDEVLAAFPATLLNIDIKQTDPDVAPYEAALAGLLHDHGRGADLIVSSFHDRALAAFREAAPEIPTSLSPGETTAFWLGSRSGQPAAPVTGPVALQVPSTFEGITVVDEPLVAAAHRAGLAVHVWTVDDEGEMEELAALGVDGIMTDRPRLLARVLSRLGMAWRPPPPGAGG